VTLTQSATLFAVFLVVLQYQNCSRINPAILSKPSFSATDGIIESSAGRSIASNKIEQLNSTEKARFESECTDPHKPNFSNVMELKDMDGIFTAFADHFSNITNMGGTLVLKATEPGAQIDQIAEFGGKLVLCGFNVKNIENTNGKIVVVDGKIENLKNHEGNIVLVRSHLMAANKLKGLVLK
jgi:hypothetical protein